MWVGLWGCRGGCARDREMKIYTLVHAYCISFHVQKCHRVKSGNFGPVGFSAPLSVLWAL